MGLMGSAGDSKDTDQVATLRGHTSLSRGQWWRLLGRVRMPFSDMMGTAHGGGGCLNALHGQNNIFQNQQFSVLPLLCLRLEGACKPKAHGDTI